MSAPIAPVMVTDELVDALQHAILKVSHIDHNRELRCLLNQFQMRRITVARQEQQERFIEENCA